MTTFISIKRRIFNSITKPLSDKQYFQLLFFLKFRRLPNIEQPKTLNEKTIWRILYDRRDIFTRVTDKVGMRDYMKEIALSAHLPKTYFIGTNPREIDFENLPVSFVAKPSHASGHIVVVDKNHLLQKEELINTCHKWLTFSYFDEVENGPTKTFNQK